MSEFKKQANKNKKQQQKNINGFTQNLLLFIILAIMIGAVIFGQSDKTNKPDPELRIVSDWELQTPVVKPILEELYDDQSEELAEALVKAKNTLEADYASKEVDHFKNLNEHETIIANQCFDLEMSAEETSFVLANANHETGQFKFLEEIDGANQAIRLGYQGGQNWYGRGYIQLTHLSNYQNWSKWTNRDLVSDPSILTRDLELSGFIACSGVKHGSFTNKGTLASYNGDWYNARAIVNGDKHYNAGCDENGCFTIGTKISDLTNHYINLIK